MPKQKKLGWHRWPVALFILSLAIPWVFPIGPARMSVYRLILCATIVPCVVLWASGRAGRIRAADIAIIMLCIWRTVSFLVVEGTQAMQSVGITSLETLGAYLIARCFIRNADDFRAMAAVLFFVIVAMLPFALIEAVTGSRVILHIFGTLFPTYADGDAEFRKGLVRVQGPFDHPILFGVFCSSGFILTMLVLGFRRPAAEKWSKSFLVALTAALSLSAGPLLGIVVQLLAIGWKRLASVTGAKLLTAVTISVYGLMQLSSLLTGRSVTELLLNKLIFDPSSYWSRNLIFQYVWLSIFNHPIFGTALLQWDKPSWLWGSVDNLWLNFAITHGIPGTTLLAATVFFSLVPAALQQGLPARESEYRAAYIVVIINWCLVGTTVTYWDATYALIIFLLGSGLWILDVSPSPAGAEKGDLGAIAVSRHAKLPARSRAVSRAGSIT